MKQMFCTLLNPAFSKPNQRINSFHALICKWRFLFFLLVETEQCWGAKPGIVQCTANPVLECGFRFTRKPCMFPPSHLQFHCANPTFCLHGSSMESRKLYLGSERGIQTYETARFMMVPDRHIEIPESQ